MLICEVLQLGLGRQLFAGLPIVTEAIAGLCKNMCFSSSEELQPFQQHKKISKDLHCSGVTNFIGTWKRNAVHSSKPL